MITQPMQTTTIGSDLSFPFPFGESEKPSTLRFFEKDTELWAGFGIIAGIIREDIVSFISELEKLGIPKDSAQNTSGSLELNFDERIKSGIIQEFADTQQRLAFPTYEEEDILNWEAAVLPPPPRRSGTIRVKLIYNGRSKPIPIEDPWE